MFVEAPALAAQAASEGTGGATTAATLAGSAPAMGAVLPMGGEEVSVMFAQAIAAHGAQFLAVGAVGVAQREAFAATVATSAATYTAMDTVGKALLSL
ncbi:PE domain-containing protein [Mycobacterium simiae]|nr:PE domain-containing protein [Mycobacterium simiae]